jgi:hypothetical protein
MAPQPIEKIESAPGNGMVSEASKPQHLVHGRAADRALGTRAARMPKLKVTKLQKKAPNDLKSLDAELKSAPAFRRPNATAHSFGSHRKTRCRGRHEQERTERARLLAASRRKAALWRRKCDRNEAGTAKKFGGRHFAFFSLVTR